ncbi:class I SAM-dependent methyltransferase [Natronosporangium hydrolyticum]|uniref:Class I SAM-dependent methyltransferase n=1 Tax=Natronosporangium hydrolyticum TaxID=2811111 RepID=A0A895YK86_9ACTN|nr:class I SAM-dependent methyltransferase [Natronosporangium hydrolyticum]QSB16415.1 class I SAM-dependent methyltransferase [Natronosporangium hydrolyticum]
MTEIKDSEAPMYDAFAAGFLEHARDGACNAHYDRPAVLAALGPVAGLTVLDLGCGPGLYAAELLARGAARVVGVDVSPEMVRLARAEVATDAATFHCQDLQSPLSWAADGEFDAAVMPLVIHHLDDRVAALREAARALRPGGRLVVSTAHPVHDWLRQGGSYFAVRRIEEEWNSSWQVAYWQQPLSATCAEFAAAGFLIEGIQEPAPAAALRGRYPELAEELANRPVFVVFALRKA